MIISIVAENQKAQRCKSTTTLQVHHKRVDGGNSLSNAEVLCHDCHCNTDSYGNTGHDSPPPFTPKTREEALTRAGNQCECTRIGCGH